jgi:serine/threonine protein kinase
LCGTLGRMGGVDRNQPASLGRYRLYGEIASGGMATVYFARQIGAGGFSKTVAIKKMHPHYAKEAEFVKMFLDEARITARVQHPNVVSILDVVATNQELFIVMEYVHGETLSRYWQLCAEQNHSAPIAIACAIIGNVLHGLHAAHVAKSYTGIPLNIVHRDVSPQNILVGVDGWARVNDFGIAKAVGRMQTTREGQLKGKLCYMAPEQFNNQPATAQTDLYSVGVVFWELLTGQPLISGESEAEIIMNLINETIEPPSRYNSRVPPSLDAIVMKALARNPHHRFAHAREMALAIESTQQIALPTDVGAWAESLAPSAFQNRNKMVTMMDSDMLFDSDWVYKVNNEMIEVSPDFVRVVPTTNASIHPYVELPDQYATRSPASASTNPSMTTATNGGRSASRWWLVPLSIVGTLLVCFVMFRMWLTNHNTDLATTRSAVALSSSETPSMAVPTPTPASSPAISMVVSSATKPLESSLPPQGALSTHVPTKLDTATNKIKKTTTPSGGPPSTGKPHSTSACSPYTKLPDGKVIFNKDCLN